MFSSLPVNAPEADLQGVQDLMQELRRNQRGSPAAKEDGLELICAHTFCGSDLSAQCVDICLHPGLHRRSSGIRPYRLDREVAVIASPLAKRQVDVCRLWSFQTRARG